MSTFNTGATIIALRAMPALAGRRFEPADAVNWRELGVKERMVGQLISMRRLGELTQENFNYAMKQRGDGALPQGFTEDGLKALGIVAPAPAAPVADEVTLAYDSVESRGGYCVKGLKVGRGVRYDVFDAAPDGNGGRLNPGGPLTSLKVVDGFIAQLEAEKARIAAADDVERTQNSPDTPQPDAGEGGGDAAAPAEGEGYGDDDGGQGAAPGAA